jgi:predicted nucleic acid-binding protein
MAGRTRGPLTLRSAFWDTSALVPLCVRQDNSAKAKKFYDDHAAVVWWTTAIEIASALARLVRIKQLTTADWVKARALSARLADSWAVIQPTDAVRTKAIQMVERYDLRAADALQLAAALEWCDDRPPERVFLTADAKLLDAAMLVGFDARRV